MGTFTSSTIFDLVSLLLVILAGVVAFFKYKLTYWDKIGLFTLPATVPFGNVQQLLTGKQSFGDAFAHFHKVAKSKGIRHIGIYFGWKPFYMPVDLDIIKHILQTDFQHFVNHGLYANEKTDPMSMNLVSMKDARWRNLRVKLTPTFTSGKMKMMFQTLADCGEGLTEVMAECAANTTPADIKDILGRFSTDIIGSCAFGLECNTLKHPDSDFRTYGKRALELNNYEKVKLILTFCLPHSVLDFFNMKLTNNDVESFFMNIIKETVQYRETNNIYRKDFMNLLLQLKNKGYVSDDGTITDDGAKTEQLLSMNDLAAQALVFFLGGFETSSTMAFALFELSNNPDIQDKLRKEIRRVLANYDNKVTYDNIMEMTYLDKVVHETLRKYPPVGVLGRVCTKDYVIPNTSLTIEKGTDVAISVLGIQHDPEYYPNPEKFDPERFSEENKSKRPALSWIPFGEGPRICIGLRFGLMQTKVGLITMLKDYKVTLNQKTKVPLVMDKISLVQSPEGGIWLNVERID